LVESYVDLALLQNRVSRFFQPCIEKQLPKSFKRTRCGDEEFALTVRNIRRLISISVVPTATTVGCR
jgi:hypothetical protein